MTATSMPRECHRGHRAQLNVGPDQVGADHLPTRWRRSLNFAKVDHRDDHAVVLVVAHERAAERLFELDHRRAQRREVLHHHALRFGRRLGRRRAAPDMLTIDFSSAAIANSNPLVHVHMGVEEIVRAFAVGTGGRDQRVVKIEVSLGSPPPLPPWSRARASMSFAGRDHLRARNVINHLKPVWRYR